MTPGMLLYDLKALGLMELADRVYDGMMKRVISPTGEFAEAYDGNDKWMNYGTAPTVYRPWESAINAEAVLYYITGLRYDHKADVVALQPYLPPGVEWIKFDNLFAGPHRISMYVNRVENGQINIDIQNTGKHPFKLELLTEPIAGIEPSEGTEVFESAAYNRTLWRQRRTLQVGERIAAFGALMK
jgi:hypothetical protein